MSGDNHYFGFGGGGVGQNTQRKNRHTSNFVAGRTLGCGSFGRFDFRMTTIMSGLLFERNRTLVPCR